jgi:hypothetical protein
VEHKKKEIIKKEPFFAPAVSLISPAKTPWHYFLVVELRNKEYYLIKRG